MISASNGSALILSNTAGAATISNSGGNHTIAAPIVLGSNLSVTATAGSTLCVSGPISETNAGTTLSVSGGGTLVLAGSNTYSGATTVDAGTLQVGNGGSGEYLASPSIVMSDNATVAFNHSDALSYGGAISGSGQLVKAGSGELTLSGSNAYSGGTTISGGALNIVAASALPGSGLLTISGGGQLVWGASPELERVLTASSPIGLDAIALSAAAPPPIGGYESDAGGHGDAGDTARYASRRGNRRRRAAAAVPEPGTLALLTARRRAPPSPDGSRVGGPTGIPHSSG